MNQNQQYDHSAVTPTNGAYKYEEHLYEQPLSSQYKTVTMPVEPSSPRNGNKTNEPNTPLNRKRNDSNLTHKSQVGTAHNSGAKVTYRIVENPSDVRIKTTSAYTPQNAHTSGYTYMPQPIQVQPGNVIVYNARNSEVSQSYYSTAAPQIQPHLSPSPSQQSLNPSKPVQQEGVKKTVKKAVATNQYIGVSLKEQLKKYNNNNGASTTANNNLSNSRTSMKSGTVKTVQSSQQYVYYTPAPQQTIPVQLVQVQGSQVLQAQPSYNQIQKQFKLNPKSKPVKHAEIILQQEKKIRKLELELQQLKLTFIEQRGQQKDNRVAEEIKQQYEVKLQEERKKFSTWQMQFQKNTDQLEKLLNELRLENQKLRDRAQDLQKYEVENTDLKFKISSIEQNHSLAHGDKQELEKRLYMEQQLIQQKESQFKKELDETRSRFESRLFQLNQQIEIKSRESDKEIALLKQNILNVSAREQSIQQQYNHQIISNQDLRNENHTLKNEIQVISSKDNTFDEKTKQIQHALETQYSQKIQLLEKELEYAQTQKTEAEKSASEFKLNLEKQVFDLQQQVQEQSQKLNQNEFTIQDLQVHLSNERQHGEGSKQTLSLEIENLKAIYDDKLVEERKAREKFVQFAKQESEQLQEEITSLKAEQLQTDKHYQERIHSLELSKNDLEKQLVAAERKVKENEEEVKEITKKVAIQEDFRKEQEDQYKKILKQKDVELQIIHDDFEQKIRAALMDQSVDLSSQRDIIGNHSEILNQQSFKKTEQSKLKSKKSKRTSKTMGPQQFQNEQSIKSITTSQRSKAETRSMYKKMSQMSMATAAMMSSKLDYSSLKELTQSGNPNLQEEIEQAQKAIMEEHEHYQKLMEDDNEKSEGGSKQDTPVKEQQE